MTAYNFEQTLREGNGNTFYGIDLLYVNRIYNFIKLC